MSAARFIGGMLLLFLTSFSRRVLIPAARSIVGMLLLFLLAISSFPVAQSRADARLHLLSVKQGETIVQAAWELRRGLNPKPDCSHFIQAVYAKAGFSYDYATTREIFTGVDGFRRVQKPQPGDLVVWQGQPGHMGIVIDPSEHSFYSSVLSGFAIENYQSHYWQARLGYPRFYRFVVNPTQPGPGTLLVSATPAHPASSVHPSNQAPLQQSQRSPESNPSQKPSLMTTATVANSASSSQPVVRQGMNQKPALVAAGSTKVASRPPAQVADSAKGASQQPAQITDLPKGGSRKAAPIAVQPPVAVRVKAELEAQPKVEAGKAAGQDAAVSNETKEIFVTSQATPSRRDVLAAINWSVNDYGERLLRDRLLEAQPSVGVADAFRIVSLDVQGNSGLAEIEVTQIAAFRNGKATLNGLVASRHLILSRQEQGWVLLNPQDLMYVNRRAAARALTDQLATLSKAPADQLQAKKTTKILHELVSAKNAGVKTAGAIAAGTNQSSSN